MTDEGDRLPTTYHRSVSTMNRTFQSGGDRLKEDFRFYVWERKYERSNFPVFVQGQLYSKFSLFLYVH